MKWIERWSDERKKWKKKKEKKKDTSWFVSPKGTGYPDYSTHFNAMERHCQPRNLNYEQEEKKA